MFGLQKLHSDIGATKVIGEGIYGVGWHANYIKNIAPDNQAGFTLTNYTISFRL